MTRYFDIIIILLKFHIDVPQNFQTNASIWISCTGTSKALGIECSRYNDIIMSAMASQITGVSIVCSTVCSGADQRKHQSSASLAFVRGIHQWPVAFPAQRTSNADIVSIWWRHKKMTKFEILQNMKTYSLSIWLLSPNTHFIMM